MTKLFLQQPPGFDYPPLSLQLSPENAEEYIDYLRSCGKLDEAAVRLAAVVNDESFVSKEGKSNYQVRPRLAHPPYPHVVVWLISNSYGTSCVT